MAVVSGAVEVYLAAGGDFELQANGDLVLAIDSGGSVTATEQRLYRLLTTNPRRFNDAGQPVSIPDDVFNPTYGAGLPALVGQPITAALIAQVKATILNALLNDPSISANPAPTVPVAPYGTSMLIVGPITCMAVSGQIYTIPSFPLSVLS